MGQNPELLPQIDKTPPLNPRNGVLIFREAFVSAGLPYFNPHRFRNTLVQLGQDVRMTPEQFKAWSQNLGHEKVLTTFLSYGEVACQRQGEIIRGLAAPNRPRNRMPAKSQMQCSKDCVNLVLTCRPSDVPVKIWYKNLASSAIPAYT